jgi:hypothetical protein
MSQDSQPDEPRLSKVIDLKLPLTWLIGVASMIVAGGFGLYQQVGSQGETIKGINEQLKDLQIIVRSGNTQAATIQGELAILKFRIENIEAEKRAAR